MEQVQVWGEGLGARGVGEEASAEAGAEGATKRPARNANTAMPIADKMSLVFMVENALGLIYSG